MSAPGSPAERYLDGPVRQVAGGGATKLASELGIETVRDLLRHYPRRYAVRGQLTALSELREGEHVTVLAEVVSATGRRMTTRQGKPLHKTDVVVTDGRHQLRITFFNQVWRERQLTPRRQAFFSGVVERFNRSLQLASPEVELVEGEGDDVLHWPGSLIPIYPATKALPSWRIRTTVALALQMLPPELDDPLPADLRSAHRLVSLREALVMVHEPESDEQVRAARRRLTWDEAFVLQVALAQRRVRAEAVLATPRVPVPGGLLERFDQRLPFQLTAGQQEVAATIAAEMARPHPMHRLLQGEVGSGKTVVALRAMLTVVDAGGQAALLAPTEVLAQQHFRSISDLLGPLAESGQLGGADVATRVALLTGSQTAAQRREALALVASGEAGVVVGTHALLEESVTWHELALVVVDEQHRFGVEQRDRLRTRGERPPHLLVMTATPIPRTVAMTVYGDLETSTLTELPRGRAPISTSVVPLAERPAWLDRAWSRVREEVAAGHQAFVVCPRIGGDDKDEAVGSGEAKRPAAAVTEVLPLLADGPLAGLRVAALHGRLHPDDKDATMRAFAAGQLDVLVATTVIEVGVDVPNASVMVVLDADRFGVSQLHQLRGRVGRGSAESLCLLVTELPEGSPGRERLQAVAATLDGAELARLDLEQRKEGDVLGAVQSGARSSLKLLSLLRDEELILEARAAATELVAADPSLSRHAAIAREVSAALRSGADYLEKG